MKKLIYIIAVLFFGVTQANAQRFYVEDCDAPLGGIVTIAVKYSTGDVKCEGGQMNIDLPEGLTFVTDADGNATGKINPDIATGFTLVTSKNGFAVYGTGSYTGEGTLLTFDLNVSPSLSIGDVKEVTVRNLSIPTADADIPNDPFTFKVTIVENIVTLDENSTTAPAAAENVNVKVLRTIKAGNWGTICLPFDMTGKQVEEVFGTDVEFADFTGYEANYSGRDCTELKVNFTSTTVSVLSNGLSANHPCLIKVTSPISDFIVRGVVVNPSAKPVVTGNTGQRYCDMYGIYVKTENMGDARSPYLFLSGNQFYYATGRTTMKAFRAYFDLYDYLSDMSASSKIGFNIDGEASYIEGLSENRIVEGVYDLSGRKIQLENGDLNKLQKGVYIIDGKKVTIK